MPRCRPDDRVAEVRPRLGSGEDPCAVVNDRGVLLGEIPRKALDADGDAAVRDVLSPGVVTLRPSEDADGMKKLFAGSDANGVWVTTSDGELVGRLRREDVERAMPGRGGDQPRR